MQENQLPRLKLRLFLLEVLIISLFGLYTTRDYVNFDPGMTLSGNEAQWLTSSAQWAAQNVRSSGYIPLWQPLLSRGEPAIDSPFAFILNPINTLPSIFLGYPNGIKASVILSMILMGVGGWYLARIMGFNSVARLFLGILLIVRGPAYASISRSYFQLGVTQMYIPWAIASTVALIRYSDRRWPVIALALTMTLLFWGGNIYFTLPTVFIVFVIVVFHQIRRPLPSETVKNRFNLLWDRRLSRRIIMVFALTIGLAAITLIPIFANQSYIGRHPSEKGAGTYQNPVTVTAQLFTAEHYLSQSGTWNENYYIFTLPFWFALLIFVGIPMIERFLPDPVPLFRNWRLWTAGILTLVFFTTWGTATNPIVAWLYDHVPLIGQWRVVNRMLTITSLWIAIFAALIIDHFWKQLKPGYYLSQWFFKENDINFRQIAVNIVIGFGITFLSFFALGEILATRMGMPTVATESVMIDSCLNWLREQKHSEHLAVFTRDYYSVSAFLRYNVRLTNINADFDPQGITSTIYPQDLSEMVPRYMIPYLQAERDFWGSHGFTPMAGSPVMENDIPCMWQNPDAVPYSFSVPLSTLNFLGKTTQEDNHYPFKPGVISEINITEPKPGLVQINYINGQEEPVVVVVQEIAWPGWKVSINGKPAKLESVGQLIGVVVPPDSGLQYIMFEFTDPLLYAGGMITLATSMFCILYLLNAEKGLKMLRNSFRNETQISVFPWTPELKDQGVPMLPETVDKLQDNFPI